MIAPTSMTRLPGLKLVNAVFPPRCTRTYPVTGAPDSTVSADFVVGKKRSIHIGHSATAAGKNCLTRLEHWLTEPSNFTSARPHVALNLPHSFAILRTPFIVDVSVPHHTRF